MSKKEGEFKKRIEKFSRLIEHAKTISEEDTIVLSELRKTVQEAKKEFPNFQNILSQKDTWLPTDFPSMEYSRDIISWFKKWFGE